MKQTKKQLETKKRNWLIFRIRGMKAFFLKLNNQQGVEACNDELKKLGAELDS
jgi:hypothetical protein